MGTEQAAKSREIGEDWRSKDDDGAEGTPECHATWEQTRSGHTVLVIQSRFRNIELSTSSAQLEPSLREWQRMAQDWA